MRLWRHVDSEANAGLGNEILHGPSIFKGFYHLFDVFRLHCWGYLEEGELRVLVVSDSQTFEVAGKFTDLGCAFVVELFSSVEGL